MTKIHCTKCNISKPSYEFRKCSSFKRGYQYNCKECEGRYYADYAKSKKGLATIIYKSQRTSSKRRHHKMPNYTKAEFSEWLFKQDKFNALYDSWVESEYLQDMKPSCDRLNDYAPYTFDNLRLVTWKENNDKHYEDVKNGINNKRSKAVTQISIDGDIVASYHSLSQASRESGFSTFIISECCNGNTKKAGGFIWRFNDGLGYVHQ